VGDLSDEELQRWLQSVPCARYEPADMQRMAAEIQRHRAAARDPEGQRSLVDRAVSEHACEECKK
jgi:hypothetical protein